MTASLLLALGVAAAAPELETFAVIVASNAPAPQTERTREALKPLRYADDDGAKYAELFGLVTERTVVHTVLDRETESLYPEVARVALAPTRTELRRSLDQVFTRISKTRAEGRRTRLFFIFVGHGSTDESGEGYLHLLDGIMTRADLFQWVVSASPANYNHVIIDACHAFSMVAGRGQGDAAAQVDAAVDQYIAMESMHMHPNTGYLLSTSAATEVHEWSGFEAGVFSHEVRSALLGGGDANGDGSVTYQEVQAFLQAANAKVGSPRAKIEPWIRPPQIFRGAPLFARSWVSKPIATVEMGGGVTGRWFVEDERGIRLADLNVAVDGPVKMLILPDREHVLHSETQEILIPRGVYGEVRADAMMRRPKQLEARGALAARFRAELFAIPFGLAFFEGYRLSASSGSELKLGVEAAEPHDATLVHWTGASLLAIGVGSLVTGVVFGQLAEDSAANFRGAIGRPTEVNALQSQAREHELLSNVLIGTGLAALLGGGAVLAW